MKNRTHLQMGGALGLIALCLTFVGCGGSSNGPRTPIVPTSAAPTSTPIPPTDGTIPDTTGVQVRPASGVLTLPAGTALLPQNFSVSTSFGEGAVNANGGFNVPVNRLAIGTAIASDGAGRARLLQVFRAGEATQISARSTALGLLLFDPLLANAHEADPTRVRAILSGLPQTTQLENAIIAFLQGNGVLTAPSPSLKAALATAVDAGVAALKNASGASRPQRAVSPNVAQSGVAVVSGDDSNPGAIGLTFENSFRRHVQVWYAGADSSGNALEPLRPLPTDDLPGLVSSPGDFNPFSIVNGGLSRPATARATVAIPTGATQVRIEVWGPGFKEINSVSASEFLQRSQTAVGMSLLLDYAAPVINTLTGFNLLSPNLNRATRLAAVALVASPEFVGIVQDFRAGNNIRAATSIVKILVTSDKGQAFLRNAAATLGASAALRASLRRIFAFYAVYETINATIDTLRAVYSLIQSRPRELFFVTKGTSTGGVPFRASLSWNQANDVDLHTFSSNGQHSSYRDLQIDAGTLNIDDRDGFGPENFTADKRLPATYRIAANYYSAGVQNDDAADSRATPCVLVVTAGSVTRRFTFTLRQSNEESDYPVTGNTASWWRPCDIRINANGTVEVLDPDTSAPLEAALRQSMTRSVAKKRARQKS